MAKKRPVGETSEQQQDRPWVTVRADPAVAEVIALAARDKKMNQWDFTLAYLGPFLLERFPHLCVGRLEITTHPSSTALPQTTADAIIDAASDSTPRPRTRKGADKK